MAEFCVQCADELDFTPANQIEYDSTGLLTKEQQEQGLAVPFLCEGCGITMVDSEGKCIGPCDHPSHLWKDYPKGSREGSNSNDRSTNATNPE